MSTREDWLRDAQAVIDRCDGELDEALTHAGFRRSIVKLLKESWPTTLHDHQMGNWHHVYGTVFVRFCHDATCAYEEERVLSSGSEER